MRVWRLCDARFAANPLDGKGGLYVAGRWHHRGNCIVYCAFDPALAALEVLVHVDWSLAPDRQLIEIDVPDDVAADTLSGSRLPADWQDVPTPDSTRDLGTAWLGSSAHLALRVPSAVMPESLNLLLNPTHPDIGRCLVVSSRPFSFDPRLRPH